MEKSDIDPHDLPHHIVETHSIPRTGWAILVEKTDCGRHSQILLAVGEGTREHLGCWEGSGTEVSWGVTFDQVGDLLCHVASHAASGTPPHEHDCPV
jgi:hypothetical protein